MFSKAVLSLYFLLASSGWVESSPTPPSTNGSINWFQCQQNVTWPVTCGTLAVPLDYTNKTSGKTLDLQLLKFNATKQPVKGSILFNPGGPGEGTREFLGGYATEMLISTGGHFNLIAFDPRGTGDTLPFSCFNDDLDRQSQSSALVMTNSSDTGAGQLWTVTGGVAEECREKNEDIGGLLSTAFVARDMMQIVDALGEDGMLRFWGFSYGTVLGATAAAMFPERIDKMVLDGVVNSVEWYAGTNREEVVQADDTVRAFVRDCLAAPKACPLARENATVDGLYNDILKLIDDVKFQPILLGSNITTGLVVYNALKNEVFSGVKSGIESAPALASYLDAIFQRNLTAYEEVVAAALADNASPEIYPDLGPEAVLGIQCPDTALRTGQLSDFSPLLKTWYQSRIGGDAIGFLQMTCAQWKMRSKETYSGPFNKKTKNPILFISSPYDPATPMVSARNMSAGFEGSRVLQHNHIGHCTISQPSKCVIDATRAYFLNGTLPAANTVCEPDFNLFANYTTAQIYQMSANGELGAVGN